MSFAEDAEKASRSGYPSRGCAVGALLKQLDPDLRAEVLNVLRDRPEITAPAIRTALVNQGVTRVPSAYTIQRHRREVCSCESP